MPIKFRCPECRQSYTISSKKAGTSLKCQKCDAMMQVPSVEKTGGGEAAAKGAAGTKQEAARQEAAKENRGGQDAADALEDQEPGKTEPEDFNEAEAQEVTSGGKEASAAVAEPPPDQEVHERLQAEDQRPYDEHADDEEDEDEEDEDEVVFGGSRAGDDEEMDLTPMVDVTFLLLIFFMITASFSIQKTLEVPPPKPDEKGAAQSQTIKDFEDQSVMVYIDSRNVISVDDEPIGDPSRLADVMRSKRMPEVLITAHEDSAHDTLVKVIDAANEIGMQKIRVGVSRGPD